MPSYDEIVPKREETVRIAVYAFDGISMFHLSVPLLTFDEVGRRSLAPWETVVFADGSSHIRTAEGLAIGELAVPGAARSADIVVIPSWQAEGTPAPAAIIDVIRDANTRGALVIGLCLGTLLLAEAGILDGRPATTHWQAFPLMQDRHPAVDLDRTSLYVDLGDVLTSAGTAAALDACLYVVRQRLGAEAANSVARALVVAPHRQGGQSQYVERPVDARSSNQPISQLLDWAVEHLEEDLSVDRLATIAHMSRRTFLRSFRATTGTTPAAWVTAQRLDESRRLLELTDHPIERIARDCGFGTAVTFRQRFSVAFRSTPSEYRRRFRVR